MNPPVMSRKRFRFYAREWVAAVLCLAIVGFVATVFVAGSRTRIYRYSMTGGSADGLRHHIAEQLARNAVPFGMILTVRPNDGSKQAVEQVERGELDFALIQGGLDSATNSHVRQVAALHIEPLHLLVKPSVYVEVLHNLRALAGKSVNLGPARGGTHDLARDVLEFAGLKPRQADGSGDYRVMQLTYSELISEQDVRKLPDAVFSVSALPSPMARRLVSHHGYHLIPLPFGDAYTLDILNRQASRSVPGSAGEPHEIAKVRVYSTQIPAFTYSLEPPSPATDLTTFGPRLLLVASARVPDRAVQRLLDVVFSSDFAQFSIPALDPTLLGSHPEYPLHEGTRKYVEFNKPVLAGDVIDILEKGTSLTGGILGASFFLWQWIRQRYRRVREVGFESYLLKVAAIEERALALELEAMLDLKELLELQRQLGRLKNQALARFAEGKLEGAELMSGFVSHVNDARAYLNRLILHERDNLEARAEQEHRSPKSVWYEALGETDDSLASSGGV